MFALLISRSFEYSSTSPSSHVIDLLDRQDVPGMTKRLLRALILRYSQKQCQNSLSETGRASLHNPGEFQRQRPFAAQCSATV